MDGTVKEIYDMEKLTFSLDLCMDTFTKYWTVKRVKGLKVACHHSRVYLINTNAPCWTNGTKRTELFLNHGSSSVTLIVQMLSL